MVDYFSIHSCFNLLDSCAFQSQCILLLLKTHWDLYLPVRIHCRFLSVCLENEFPSLLPLKLVNLNNDDSSYKLWAFRLQNLNPTFPKLSLLWILDSLHVSSNFLALYYKDLHWVTCCRWCDPGEDKIMCKYTATIPTQQNSLVERHRLR